MPKLILYIYIITIVYKGNIIIYHIGWMQYVHMATIHAVPLVKTTLNMHIFDWVLLIIYIILFRSKAAYDASGSWNRKH